MFRNFTFLLSVVFGVLVVSDLQAQYFGGGGGSPFMNSNSGYYGGYRGGITDPRLGYCLENDCCGGGRYGQQGGAYGQYGGQRHGVARSRFVVERGGRRVLTYIGTYEGFSKRFPQYASRLARNVSPQGNQVSPDAPMSGQDGSVIEPPTETTPMTNEGPQPETQGDQSVPEVPADTSPSDEVDS